MHHFSPKTELRISSAAGPSEKGVLSEFRALLFTGNVLHSSLYLSSQLATISSLILHIIYCVLHCQQATVTWKILSSSLQWSILILHLGKSSDTGSTSFVLQDRQQNDIKYEKFMSKCFQKQPYKVIFESRFERITWLFLCFIRNQLGNDSFHYFLAKMELVRGDSFTCKSLLPNSAAQAAHTEGLGAEGRYWKTQSCMPGSLSCMFRAVVLICDGSCCSSSVLRKDSAANSGSSWRGAIGRGAILVLWLQMKKCLWPVPCRPSDHLVCCNFTVLLKT